MASPIIFLQLAIYVINVILLPYSFYSSPVEVLAGYAATIAPHLPPIYNATGALTVLGPAAIYYTCYNNLTHSINISGYIDINLTEISVELAGQSTRTNPLVIALVIAVALVAVVAFITRPPSGLGLRLRSKLATEEQIRRNIVSYLDRVGAATLSQIVTQLKQEEGLIRWHLYVLERERRVKSVKVGPYIFYFTKAKRAAEVMLASLDPALVPPEDRALLDLWASS